MQLKRIIVAALVLQAMQVRVARAAASTKEKSGAAIGGSGEGSGGGASATEAGVEQVFERSDLENKHWQVTAGLEYHRLVQTDFQPGVAASGPPDTGNASNRDVLLYDVSWLWDPTPRDRVWAEWGFIQRFIKNPGEGVCPSSGPADGIVAYRRSVPLRRGFVLRVQPRLDLGLSCESVRYESLIAAPRLGVQVDRDFLGWLSASLEAHGYWYLVRYTSYSSPGGDDLGGGDPTPLTSLHLVARVLAVMPFHRPLSVGLLATASATWFHQVGGSNASIAMNGTTTDPLVGSQALQNNYGGEIFVRYALKPVRHVFTDVVLAYADGDPNITGYQSLLHDNGRASFNLFYRSVSEFYMAFTFRY